MSKELDDFRKIRNLLHPFENEETFNAIKKSLKALEIIKNKVVLIDVFLESEDVNDYNEFYGKSKDKHLTPEEYELLKEALLWNTLERKTEYINRQI